MNTAAIAKVISGTAIVCALMCSCMKGSGLPGIVPLPGSVVAEKGEFVLSGESDIYIASGAEGMEYAADELKTVLSGICGVAALESDDPGASVVLGLSDELGVSSYILDISPDRIKITGGDPAGVFYAVQTLKQLVPVQAYKGKAGRVSIPAVVINDSPKMMYRGVMLDAARHFFTKDEVKTFLDIMALHKMNVFHWHLTDDQGWRIEIDSYPELVGTGSVRKRTIVGKDPGGEYDETTVYDETPHSGYYTKDDIREIVEYARRRFITVIPEVEFPGHAVAALASYPWLGCTGEQYEVRQTWDIDDRVFCIGKESTFRFFEDVLAEVTDLFPSEYIHIGGDECPSKMWEKCPHCNRRMEQEHLDSYRQLQAYGTFRLEKFLESRGRRIIGWDEILEAGISPSAVVMSWRGTEGGIKAAKSGNYVVMSPTGYSYFDYYQTRNTENEPLAWGGYLPLEKVYSFDPYEGLDADDKKFVLGVQANLWTEYIPDFRQAEYMLLPRLAAMSEVAWSSASGNYPDFRARLADFLELYRSFGYTFSETALRE